MAIDVSRSTSGVALPDEVSGEIWQKLQQGSAVAQLSRSLSLPGNGVTVNVITGDPVASVVGETGQKPVSRPSFSNKKIAAHKIAVMVPFSDEFRRDASALYSACVDRLPGALAAKIDSLVFNTDESLANFDFLGGVTAQGIGTKTGKGLALAASGIATEGGLLNGWALSPQGQAVLLTAEDGNGRPLFLNSYADGAVPRALGAPVIRADSTYKAGTPNQLGFAGDWTKAVFGTVQGVQISLHTEGSFTDGTVDVAVSDGTEGATVAVPNIVSLIEHNMFLVRAEVEFGFRVEDADYFRKITDATVS